MTIKLAITFIFFISSYGTFSQTNEKEKYTKKEQFAFLKIYKHTLDNPFDITTSMQKNVPKIKIEEARFSEILQAQFAGNEPTLTAAENKEMAVLQNLMELDKKEYDSLLKKYAISQGISYEKYLAIEKLYHENKKFQKKIDKLSKAK
jgi:hypothetical protein